MTDRALYGTQKWIDNSWGWLDIDEGLCNCKLGLLGVLLVNAMEGRNFLKKVSPASAFLPLVNWVSPASAFRHQDQSGTIIYGWVRHGPAMINSELAGWDTGCNSQTTSPPSTTRLRPVPTRGPDNPPYVNQEDQMRPSTALPGPASRGPESVGRVSTKYCDKT